MRSLDSHMQPQLKPLTVWRFQPRPPIPNAQHLKGFPLNSSHREDLVLRPTALGSPSTAVLVPMEATAEDLSSQVLSGMGLLGSWFVFLSTFKALKALYRRFISTSRIYSSLAAKELELGKATVPRPHPQPRKSHSLNVGPWSSWDWECSSVEEHLSLSEILRVLGSIPDTAQKNRPPHMRASHSTVSVSWFNNLYPVPTSQGNSVSISESIHDKNQDRSNQKITFLKSWLQASAHLH